MAYRKRNVILFSLLFVTAIFISACERSYSTVPLDTPVGEDTSAFESPAPTNAMEIIENFATSTAAAAETAAVLTAGTPDPTQKQESEDSSDSNSDANETPDVSINPTLTPTLVAATPSATQPIPTTITNRPASYTLQKGEFPYCIARRFNVDPAELLNLNSLANGDVYYPNLTLTIPQTGSPFPGTRSLRSHPDTYTVADASLSLYGIACVYGDVDPAAIAQANNLQLTSTLTAGQQLTIP